MALGMNAATKKMYSSFTPSNQTLTYYYDDQMDTRLNTVEYTGTGTRFQKYNYLIKKAVIDVSMKDYHPSTLAYLFCGNTDGGMAYLLSNLTTIVGMENLNTDQAVYLNHMFAGCKSLTTVDLSHFNTEKARYLDGMFTGCTALQSVNLSSFSTPQVKRIDLMFYRCESLTSLDLSSFSFLPYQVANAESMFYECKNLTTIYCDQDWNELGMNDISENMFEGCDRIRGEMGTTPYFGWVPSAFYARPDQGSSKPGYFTRSGCYAPSSIKVISVTDHTASISWSAPSSNIRWEVNYQPNYSPSKVKTKEVTTTSCLLDDLYPETVYRVWIKGYCSASQGAYSSEIRFETAKCQTPNALRVTDITATSAKISWSASEAATKFFVRYYPMNNDAYYNEKTTTGNSYTLTGLEPGTGYYVYVVAQCGYNNHISEESAKSSFTTLDGCPAPKNLRAADIRQTSVLLSWDENPDVQNWNIKLVYANGFMTLTSSTNYRWVIGLRPYTTYEAQVSADCSDGETDPVTKVTFTTEDVPCAAPTNLKATATSLTSITLDWDAREGQKQWEVVYAMTNMPIATSSVIANQKPYTLRNLDLNTSYNISVRAVCDDETSAYSNQITETTNGIQRTLPMPTNLQVLEVTDKTITLSWTPGGDETTWFVDYNDYRMNNYVMQTATEIPFTLKGLQPGRVYDIAVEAVKGDERSEMSDHVSVETEEGPCKRARNLEAYNLKPTSAVLSWTPGNSEGGEVWNVYYRGMNDWKDGGVAESVPYLLTGLEPGIEYDIMLFTECGEQSSLNSNIISFTTPQEDPCPMPTGLTAAEITDKSATLSWTTDADQAWVEYKTADAEEYSGVMVNGAQSVELTELLLPNTDYMARVMTYCNGGTYSDYTEVYEFHTEELMGIAAPGAKHALKAHKILKDGQLYLLYNGFMYNVQGKKVK